MTETNPSIVNLRVHWDAKHALKCLAAERGETLSQVILALVAAARRVGKKQKSGK